MSDISKGKKITSSESLIKQTYFAGLRPVEGSCYVTPAAGLILQNEIRRRGQPFTELVSELYFKGWP